ncbi:MAG: hypothetical protein CL583_01345 [Alteromonadaceae bacterium]|nr:hypothetical protein [Alteromonadaceae bacterium]
MILVLLLPVFLASCGGDDESGSQTQAQSLLLPGVEDLPVELPVDLPDELPEALLPPDITLPIDLASVPVRVPEAPVSRPRIQGLATNSGIVELGITNDNTVGFLGQSAKGDSVELELDGEFIGSAMGRSDGTSVFDYQSVPLPEGAHELAATRVTSRGEKLAAEQTFNFAYLPDAMPAPVILGILPDTGIDDADGITSATEIELFGVATPNLPVMVYLNGLALVSTVADQDGNWLFDYRSESLPGGIHPFSARTEYEGKISATSAAYSVHVDLVAAPPTIGIDNDSSGGSGVSNNPAVIIGGTTEPGSAVEVIRDGTPVGNVTADENGDWQFEDSDTTLPDGDYDYSAVVTDPAGNTSDVSSSVSVEIDTAAPSVPAGLVIAPDTGSDTTDGVTGENELTFTGTGDPGSVTEVFVDGDSAGTTVVGTDGTWSLDNSASPLPDGSYTITADATDTAGNTSAISAPITVVVDVTAPSAPTIAGISPDSGTDSSDGLTSAASLALQGSGTAGEVITVYVGGTEAGTAVVASNGLWALADLGGPFADGTYAITATATDLAGNTSAASGSFSMTVDTVAPAVPSGLAFAPDSGVTGDSITNTGELQFSGSATAGAFVHVYANGSSLGMVTADGGGNWTLDTTGAPLSTGSYNITARSADGAGNTSSASTPLSLTISTVIAAPTISSMSDDTGTNGDGVTSDNSLAFTGTAEPGSTVELLINSVAQTPVVTTNGSGLWTWNSPGPALAEGSYDVSARATSTVGVVSALSPVFDLVVDTTAPAITVVSPASGATGVGFDGTLTVSFGERVFASSGQLSVYRQSNNAVIEQVPLSDARVTGRGTDTLSINLNSSLIGGTTYYVLIDSGSLTDLAGNAYAGISDSTSWAFTTAATAVDMLYPPNGATGTSPAADLSIRFNEAIERGTGNLRLKRVSDDSVFATVDIAGASATVVGSDVVSFDIPLMDAGVAYYVELDAGAIQNTNGVTYAGFAGNGTWSFETSPGSVATVTGISSPLADGTYATGAVIPVHVTFSEAVNVTDGSPVLALDLDGGTGIATYAAGTGSAVLTFNYTVEYGDISPDLGYLNTGALGLGGSRIRTATYADADLTLPIPGSAGSLSGTKDLVVAGQSINAGDPGDNGSIVSGNQAGGALGASLAGVGDVNGDGFEDYAVAAPGIGNGVVYVLWGRDASPPADITLGAGGAISAASGFRILGRAAGDVLGASLGGGAGDFNGDGYDDIVIGAPGSDAGGVDAGAVYVIWGQAGSTRGDVMLSGFNHSAGATNAAGIVILGSEAGQLLGEGVLIPNNGQTLAIGGDMNGDGVHDLVIGHPGSDLQGLDAGLAYVVWGERAPTRPNLDLAALDDSGILLTPGSNAGWQLGQSVSFVHDFNNNGYADLLLGASGASNLAFNAGAAYLVFGGDALVDGDVTTLGAAEGLVLTTALAEGRLGTSVAAGDFNGDGIADLAAGAPGVDTVYIVYGYEAASYSGQNLDIMVADDGYAITSGASGDAFGHAIASAGDFNADGIDDLLLGAHLSDMTAADAGAVWVLKGSRSDRAATDLFVLADDQFISVAGGSAGDQLGRALGGGDFNGDGFSDVALGAPGNSTVAAGAGQVAAILGDSYGSNHLVGTTGSFANELIIGSSGDDLVSGGGGADAVSTGAGMDIISIADLSFSKIRGGRGNPVTGMDVLQFAGSGMTLDLTTMASSRIDGIELVDLNGQGNAINLDPLSLLGMSRETHQLYVVGDGSDTVSVKPGDLWLGDGTETVGADTYKKYVSRGAELFIDGLVNQDDIATFNATQRYNLDTTSSGAGVGSDVTDFPVLVRITSASIIDATEADARDIRVMGPDGSLLDYEIERWDQANNLAELWVKVPVVYGNTNGATSSDRNFFTLLYDGGAIAIDGQNPDGVWSKYSGVWHLNESVSTASSRDSTAFANDAAMVSGQGNSQNAIAGRGRQFTADQSMSVPFDTSSMSIAGNVPFSYSAWIRQPVMPITCFGSNRKPMIQRGTGGNRLQLLSISQTAFACNVNSEQLILADGTELGGTIIGINAYDPGWIFFTVVYDGSSTTFYKDGNVFASDAGTVNMENGQPLGFGASGMIFDELRYGRHAKSAAEVRLMYYSQRPVATGWGADTRALVTPAP